MKNSQRILLTLDKLYTKLLNSLSAHTLLLKTMPIYNLPNLI